MRKRGIIALLTLSLLSTQALALTLTDARQQGRVGETQSGYLAAIKQDNETLALVKKINQARSESYQQLAQSHSLSQQEVARLAGKKLIEKAQQGEYVQGINGQWVRK
ncbi:YdbL family protein [Kluyvera cryocrescens]|uniref:YdbL family protein n=1 Tax=Kluyvera cryocrescens TaxID=580 RepID=UPI003D7F3894